MLNTLDVVACTTKAVVNTPTTWIGSFSVLVADSVVVLVEVYIACAILVMTMVGAVDDVVNPFEALVVGIALTIDVTAAVGKVVLLVVAYVGSIVLVMDVVEAEIYVGITVLVEIVVVVVAGVLSCTA